MYRERIESTAVKSGSARRLKQLMLNYHDYQRQPFDPAHLSLRPELASWQSARLKATHADLYENQNFQSGIDFLLLELYGAKDFSARDRDLERIFPKLVKLLPDKLIHVVSNLVELNLLTQQLDDQLIAHLLEAQLTLNPETYAHAYIRSSEQGIRERQLELVGMVGDLLDRHARNPLLRASLAMSERPARRAGLEALHSFLTRGFDAFYAMRDVDVLMQTVLDRELTILARIYDGLENPFAIH